MQNSLHIFVSLCCFKTTLAVDILLASQLQPEHNRVEKNLGFVICAVALAVVEQAVVRKKKHFHIGYCPYENVESSISSNNQMPFPS